ncbi:S-adenosyl-L-methionine-dependent methyltransferase [Gracilaria domingensis]|nr:S-adenosyl-L-methionine-dependent methyltransferase [Gracilaria domingensis]
MKGTRPFPRSARVALSLLVLFFIVVRPFKPRYSSTHSFSQKISECADPFYVRVPNTDNTPHTPSSWPCVVKPPLNYTPPLTRPDSLWRTPLANVGELDTSNSEHRLHLANQRWARLEADEINIREEGGTSGRSFANNFEYVKFLIQQLEPIQRCAPNTPQVMLDMGAGIGSVSAALFDERGGSGAVKALSYVWPDNYLRLQTIISDRGLPSFLANFTGALPFPSSTFDIVHCKWCWHHNAGYDKWLKEVNRLLVPGGFFVFTFAPEGSDLLEHPAWEEALARQPFRCKKVHRIITMCQKHHPKINVKEDGDEFLRALHCPSYVTKHIAKAKKKYEKRLAQIQKERLFLTELVNEISQESTPRILNVNCPNAALCAGMDHNLQSSVLHVNPESQNLVVEGILNLGGLAMLHNWKNNIPVYPRSFDVVNIGCDARTKGLFERPEFWLELHRVLRPGGYVVLSRSFCEWRRVREISLRPYGFSTKKASAHSFVARREMYVHS